MTTIVHRENIGYTDETDPLNPVYVPINGFHVITDTDFGVDFDIYRSTDQVKSIVGKIWGVDSYHYTFESEDQFIELYGDGINPEPRLSPENYKKEKAEITSQFNKNQEKNRDNYLNAIYADGTTEATKVAFFRSKQEELQSQYAIDLASLKTKYGY